MFTIQKLTPEKCDAYKDALTQYIYESVRSSDYMDSYQMENAADKCAELRAYLGAGKAVSYGAFDGQALVGFVWAYAYPYREDGKRVYVSVLHVAEAYRNHSLGKVLLEQIEREAQDIGCPTVFLHTEGRNEAAQRFYQRMGYRLERVQLVKTAAEKLSIISDAGGGKVEPLFGSAARPVFSDSEVPAA